MLFFYHNLIYKDLNIKWIVVGLTAGAVGTLLILHNQKILFTDEGKFSYENDLLDRANEYLLNARNKAEEIVKNAEEQSILLLEEAGKSLTLIKEKTKEIHDKISIGKTEEAMKIKGELENIISDFKTKLK